MKIIFQLSVLICSVIFLTRCSKPGSSPANEHTEKEVEEVEYATKLVNQSIEAHGGFESWTKLREISYKKTTTLFDSIGEIESKIIQMHKYTLQPSLNGTIEWQAGEDLIKIIYSDGLGTKYVNDIAELDSGSMVSATNTFMSSFYVLFQPWKLLDGGTKLDYLGIDTLENAGPVHVIMPTYGERKEGDDIWWYFVDVDTKRVLANMVDHTGRKSLISNLEYDTTTELVFNYHRKSHFVDDDRKVKYLRAEYFYEDFQLIF